MGKKESWREPLINTVICLKWVDASHQKGPISRNDFSGTYTIRTCGWLVAEDRDSVSVAMDHVPSNNVFRDVQHILKRNIVDEKRIQIRN